MPTLLLCEEGLIIRANNMLATLNAFDEKGRISHEDTRFYPDLSLLWEHIGCQQNNRSTVRVQVVTEYGCEYHVNFSPWTSNRRYTPSPRFQKLLRRWVESSSRVAQRNHHVHSA
jgi:hypothetical protein